MEQALNPYYQLCEKTLMVNISSRRERHEARNPHYIWLFTKLKKRKM